MLPLDLRGGAVLRREDLRLMKLIVGKLTCKYGGAESETYYRATVMWTSISNPYLAHLAWCSLLIGVGELLKPKEERHDADSNAN